VSGAEVWRTLWSRVVSREDLFVKALQFERNPPRFAAASAAAKLKAGAGARVGPLRLRDVDPPDLPGDDWQYIRPRLAGICGSDLSTIDGHASRYFEPIVSFPFVPGHEVVADTAGSAGDDRVVLEPVLGCVSRGIDPVCPACARGDLGGCERIAFGGLQAGLQSGFCCDTGGGWSTVMVAHESQLHSVPAGMSDDAAVMVEPTACGIHGALRAGVSSGDTVVVVGAGTLGLLTIAAVRHFTEAARLIAVAKHPLQRSLARELGADVIVEPQETPRAVRRVTGSLALGDGDIVRLTGGADHVIDCVGSERSLAQGLRIVRPGGRITMVGMPGHVNVDLTGLWQREVELVGAYAYGTETINKGERRRTFELAFEMVQAADLGRLVSATYPLSRYRDAIVHAANAGPRGAVRVAFDMRAERERTRQ
jgi:threonine dehydrogenase-like Zn-dependent dehydrogenase